MAYDCTNKMELQVWNIIKWLVENINKYINNYKN